AGGAGRWSVCAVVAAAGGAGGGVPALLAAALLAALATDVLVEAAQELGILIGREGALTARPLRSIDVAQADAALTAHDQPGDRPHPGDQHDEHGRRPFGQATDLVVLGLHAVCESEDRQGDGKNCE